MELAFILKAIAANQFARWFPRAYVRKTSQTGRGAGSETPQAMAEYCFGCVEDYVTRLRNHLPAPGADIAGRRILELGPGDHLGTALILYAMGAKQVVCLDRFPLLAHSELNLQCYASILKRLSDPQRERAMSAFHDPRQPRLGLRPVAIEYRLTSDGTCGETESFDLILSRAVLEYVPDIRVVLADEAQALVRGGLALHLVDLRGLTLDRRQELDFLAWPEWLYQLMGSHKGVPNRRRVDAYRMALSGLPLTASFETFHRASAATVNLLRPLLAKPFRDVSDADLVCTAFWLTLVRSQQAA